MQEADAVDSLHCSRQVGQHAHVCIQPGQPERRQRRDPAAKGALDGAGLGRLDIYACQALQTERVSALKDLGTAEDIVELAEADGALQVRARVLRAAGLEGGQMEVRGWDNHRDMVGGGREKVGGRRGYWWQSLTCVWLAGSEIKAWINTWEHGGGVIWGWDQISP